MLPRIPLSTYRLQFNDHFTFRDAASIVDYLHALGIGDCYTSSLLTAVPRSPHGYDVADPTRLNPDLGSDDDYWQWTDSLQRHGMGHIVDVVPNHMGIAKSANPWWLDVLENGPSSRFARFFDIEWHPVKQELTDKLLIPILGDQYGGVLERQELRLEYDRGAFVVRYYDDILPVAPDTFDMILRLDLDAWLEQHAGDAADELLSILTASEHLPPRSARDADQIAVRAREKEVVKRRLAALTERCGAVAEYVSACVKGFNGTPGQPRTFDLLDRLLTAQSYRLAHWRVASEEINYRRFFDINQLAALRMEDPVVFDEVHKFVLDLIRRGGPTGLRIDHVDGLFSPADYLHRLQSSVGGDKPFFIVVEKILGKDEALRADWPVSGTTGYEFATTVNSLFIDSRNERALDDIYRRFTRERRSFADLAYDAKKQVLHETMSGDINSLAHQLNRFSERNRHYRDFTLYSLISTVKELIACFPVYRTYVTGTDSVCREDAAYIRAAVRCGKRRSPRLAGMVFDFVERILMKQTAVVGQEDCEERARFIGKFQQITSPVAAKGIEDTAFYVYPRLLSLNEVGSDPTQFGLDPGRVHQWMIERQKTWPSSLSATATHDTKRGEDGRARLNVLSEIPGAWKAAVTKWRTLNRRLKVAINGSIAPDRNEEYFFYQTLVSAWPFEMTEPDGFKKRIAAYMTKALREAKVHTSWLSPNEEYERAVSAFVEAVLDRRRSALFYQSFETFHMRIAELGIYNSLAQLLIKITAPGVPDFYQGTELWDLTLVDPDNRRPVDYGTRRRALAAMGEAAAPLLTNRRDGRVKMFVTKRALAARQQWRDVYEQGTYLPLESIGTRRDCMFAFARVHRGVALITCVPRMIASLIPDVSAPPIGCGVWGDTRIELPDLGHTSLRDVFTGFVLQPQTTDGRSTMAAGAIFSQFPIALLAPCST